MNYSEFTYDYNPIISNITSNDASSILDDFEILNINLDSYKKKIEDLESNKIYFDNYISNLQNNHLNIMNIINNYKIINDNDEKENENQIFIKYNLLMKENYNNWLNKYYTIKLFEFKNSIEIIEKKITEFRNLFIYIMNKISKPNTEAKKICPICFENEVDICLNPCGHTLCNKCVILNRSNYISNKCYSCRTVVNDYIKIYFSL